MDFHSLSRRELQAYCKKNKIPANMTNAAMADALKALKIVEGIEEFMQQPSQSESVQSSIESLENNTEVTSPYVPPTGGRSTLRRNVLKDGLESVTSVTTTRRTTRKTATKASDESHVESMETPAMVAQASRRKVQMASACRKMDSQLKECIEEEKKDALTTPAPVASRRGKRDETEKKVYSTRRSVRLAVKNVQMVTDLNREESGIPKNELFAKDFENQEVNMKDVSDCNEMSGITGVDATDCMEEKSEVVSAEKQDITIGGELELESTVDATDCMEEKSEVVSAEKQDITIGGELELESTAEVEEACIDYVVEVKQEEEICDNTEYPGNEVQQSEVDAVASHEAGFCEEVEAVLEDDKEMTCEDVEDLKMILTELRLHPEEVKQSENVEMESLQVEESQKTADGELLNGDEATAASGVEDCVADTKVVVEPTDNKENIGSGSEVVMMKEKMKAGESVVDLKELSMAKLTKMLKEKLEITKKTSKHGNEVGLPRTALQALSENHMS